MQNNYMNMHQDIYYRKQSSNLSVIPEGNGSNSQLMQHEDREPTQEGRQSEGVHVAWSGDYRAAMLLRAGNGSNSQLVQQEDRNNIQEFSNSDMKQSVQGHEMGIRKEETTLPNFGRLREKYTDPKRFLDTPNTSPNQIQMNRRPDPIGYRCYSDNNLMNNRRFQA